MLIASLSGLVTALKAFDLAQALLDVAALFACFLLLGATAVAVGASVFFLFFCSF